MTQAEYNNLIDSLFPSGQPEAINSAALRSALKSAGAQLRLDAANITAWSPVLARIANGQAVVLRVVDWINGQGAKPAVGMYLSATGYVTDIAQAGDFRGAIGPAGTVSSNSGMTVSGDLSVAGSIMGSGNAAIGDNVSSYRLTLTDPAPSAGTLLLLSNSRNTMGRTGVFILFNQSSVAAWKFGMLPDLDTFVLIGNGNVERWRVDTAGNMGVGTTAPTARMHVNGANGAVQFRLEQKYTPGGTADANGQAGSMAWDDNYLYMKTAAGWKRATLSTF